MTLVELMISMLILTLVCVAWLEIIGIQSARKEARRREAVERLVGMMDAFSYSDKANAYQKASYKMTATGNAITFTKGIGVQQMFDSAASPIGYQLVVGGDELDEVRLFGDYWGSNCRWLVGRLYNSNGENEVGKPFFALPVCLGN